MAQVLHYALAVWIKKETFMTKNISLFLIVASVSSSSMVAFAHDKNGPCKPVCDACESAGYGHDTEGKKVWEDCVIPIVKDGKTISGVNVSDSQVKQCKDFKAAKKAWEKNWIKNHPSSNAGSNAISD